MDLILVFLIGLLSLLGAALAKLLADEFKAWSPWLVRKIIQFAVRNFSDDKRERFTEEWHSHVMDVPGDIGKIVVALGFITAARRMPDNSTASYPNRRLNVLGASVLFALALPLLVVVAIAIKIDSRGPALFWQTRRGRNGKMFRFVKFRTMAVNLDAPKVTRIGKFLRKTGIDLLPLLLNVIKGEMALFGGSSGNGRDPDDPQPPRVRFF